MYKSFILQLLNNCTCELRLTWGTLFCAGAADVYELVTGLPLSYSGQGRRNEDRAFERGASLHGLH